MSTAPSLLSNQASESGGGRLLIRLERITLSNLNNPDFCLIGISCMLKCPPVLLSPLSLKLVFNFEQVDCEEFRKDN